MIDTYSIKFIEQLIYRVQPVLTQSRFLALLSCHIKLIII